ncbi:hypothetical protein VTI74DRAFT_5001 [Chaetomium olivicolor]
MRLLNVHTREIREFLSDANTAPYAILSHTWAEEEVTFEDFQHLPKDTLKAKKGYQKIDYCCTQAAADGYDWTWIDTCCIDKSSSAELSEAINSMFRWYRDSSVCYAYFDDVQESTKYFHVVIELTGARWFTRGWTLQELLAPKALVLYSRDWKRIGLREEWCHTISDITGIDRTYLCGTPLEEASVSKRMSWAARRSTSRLEDIAYCLLGLFDVNMPLLYGEGKKAFRRLQEEILKANPMDHTLFAWGKIVAQPRRQVEDILQLRGLKPIEWNTAEASVLLQGLLADSPSDFQDSAAFSPWEGAERFYDRSMRTSLTQILYPTIAGSSIILELPVLPAPALSAFHWPSPQISQLRLLWFAVLLCKYKDSRGPAVLLPLQPWGYARYGRTEELLFSRQTYDLSGYINMRSLLQIEPQRHRTPRLGDFLVRRWDQTFSYEFLLQNFKKEVMCITDEGLVTGPTIGRIWSAYCRLTKMDTKYGFALVFERVQDTEISPWLGLNSVSLVPMIIDDQDTGVPIQVRDGFTWYHKSQVALGQFETIFGRTMAVPEDTWRLDVAPFPVIEVQVKRERVGQTPAVEIDVVDLIISDRSDSNGLPQPPLGGL